MATKPPKRIASPRSTHLRIPQPEASQLVALAKKNERKIQAEGMRAIRAHLARESQ